MLVQINRVSLLFLWRLLLVGGLVMLVMFDKTVIGDRTKKERSIYRLVTERTGLRFHAQYRYCISDETPDQMFKLKNMGFELKYFDGCFNPYLCWRTKK